MPSTYTPIATTTLGSATNTVTFSSIAGTYTDLVVISSFTVSSDSANVIVRFNNDSGTNYSSTRIEGTGTTASSNRGTNATSLGVESNIGSDDTSPSTFIFNVMNYSNSTTYKTMLTRTNAAVGTYPGLTAQVGLWRSTSAINRIDIIQGGVNFKAGSTFTLYGIASA